MIRRRLNCEGVQRHSRLLRPAGPQCLGSNSDLIQPHRRGQTPPESADLAPASRPRRTHAVALLGTRRILDLVVEGALEELLVRLAHLHSVVQPRARLGTAHLEIMKELSFSSLDNM